MASQGGPRRSPTGRLLDALIWGVALGAAGGAVLGAAISGVGAGVGAVIGALLYAPAEAITTLRRRRLAPTQLWLHALSEATDDEEIRRYFRRHLREVHDYVADILRRAQAADGIHPDRDVDAEAWIGLGIGLLRSVQDRFGGLLGEDDVDAIASSRWTHSG